MRFVLAGSCPPTMVLASLQCAGNVGVVTWTPASRADLYVASTLPSAVNGRVYNCSSSGTSCSLTGLNCGDTVTISVVTVERGCQSQPSDQTTLKTGQI